MNRLKTLYLQVLLAGLHLALAAPGIYMLLGLPMVLRQEGFSGTMIGLFQLAGLPAVLKFALALPVDYFRPKTGHYKTWTAAAFAGYAVNLVAIGTIDITGNWSLVFSMTLTAAFVAALADVPLNALAIKLLPPTERTRAGGFRSAALFVAAIVGGGAMVLVYNRWGWQAPFLVMAGTIALLLVPLAFLKEDLEEFQSESKNSEESSLASIRGFFDQPGAKSWALVLATCFPFLAAAWVYAKPLLLDLGFSPDSIAWTVGILGGTVGALASLAVGWFARTNRAIAVLTTCTGLNAVCVALLAWLVIVEASHSSLIAAVLLLAACVGATATLAFGLMMSFARAQMRATDYGIQASLFTLTRIAVPPVAGILLDRWGYELMLLALCAALTLSFFGAVRASNSVIQTSR